MKDAILFQKKHMGGLELQNRIAMAPMTRCRAIGNIPNDLMAEYYQQRNSAGLLITEGTSPAPEGLGYARIPGIFSEDQVAGWKKVTDAAHAGGAKIAVQLMHTGRISHPLNMPEGTKVLAPSAVTPKGQMWTDSAMMQDFPEPHTMNAEELERTKQAYVSAARNAMAAGFDFVELHGANGYLLEQFLSPFSNVRTDDYGGSIENRCRFVLETAEAVAKAIGRERTGIRLSPYGVASDMPHYPEIDATYDYLSRALNTIGIEFIHLVDHSAMGAPQVPDSIREVIRKNFNQTLILSGGYTFDRAEADLAAGKADFIAFGKPFINNPDLVHRLQHNLPLNTELKTDLFYAAGPEGYTDYPVIS